MRPELLPKDILFDNDAHAKIARGVEVVYKVAKSAYGPKAGNVMYEMNWPVGSAKISRDGVTNIRQISLPDRTENMAVKAVRVASEKNNSAVGDGTTAVGLLVYYYYTEGRKLVAAGHNQMAIAKSIQDSAIKAIEYIDSVKYDITEEDLLAVARVSSGDDAIAELLANTVKAVGTEGGITVEEHAGLGVYADVIDGFYMRKGFSNVNLIKDGATLSSDFENVPILLLDKYVSDGKEMALICNKVKGAGFSELLILGDVVNDAMEFLERQRGAGTIIATVAGIPASSGMKTIVLDDVALLTGARVYKQGDTGSTFTVDYLGACERALVDELSTTIIGGGGEGGVEKRITELKAQLKKENHPVTVQSIKDRLSRLSGKVGIVKVGGATDIEREELRLRVDDAVCALQSARRDGTVPGGGTTLARVVGTAFDRQLQRPFLELMSNAGENGELKLGKMLESPVGYGYDLKNPTDEPIDLRKAGILDPTMVIKEVVRNAASIASSLITVNSTITYTDDIVKALEKLPR